MDIFSGGVQARGGCVEWGAYVEDVLPTLAITKYPSRVVLASFEDGENPRASRPTLECSEVNITRTMISRLVHLATEEKATGHYSYTCSGRIWSLGKCTPSGTPYLCANCSRMCSTDSSKGPQELSCRQVSVRADDMSTVLVVDFTPMVPAATLSNMSIVSTNRSSLLVGYRVNHVDGSVVCGAIAAGKVPLSLDVLLLSNNWQGIDSTSGLYAVEKLIPSTSYAVYCAVMSSMGVVSDWDVVISDYVVSGRTACCIAVNVDIRTKFFSDALDSQSALTVRIDHAVPGVALSAHIQSTRIGANALSFTPSVVTFSGSATPLTRSVSYLRSPSGEYLLNCTLSGLSARHYFVTYNAMAISVKKSADPPDPPVALSAVFSNDGTVVIVQFDSATNRLNRTNSFACSLLFAMAGRSMKSCFWTNDATVNIHSSGDTGARVGDLLSVKGGILRAKCVRSGSAILPPCTQWAFSAPVKITIQKPSNPLVPTVSVIAPTEIGACDSLRIDLSGTSGSGGRSFAYVRVTASSLGADVTGLARFLANVTSVTAPIRVASSLLTPGRAYNFGIKVCSFLGTCGEKSLAIVVSLLPNKPFVSILSAQRVEMYRYDTLRLSGDAYVSGCDSFRDRRDLLYTWKVSRNGVLESFLSESLSPSVFMISPYKLATSETYSVTLTVQHAQSKLSSSNTVSVVIKQGSLVARVAGASTRTVPADGSEILDASASFDKDDGSNTQLTATFACMQTAPFIVNNCPLLLETMSPLRVRVAVPSGMEETLLHSQHILTVTMIHKIDGRVASTDVFLKVVPPQSPKIHLVAPEQAVVSPSDKLRITASIIAAAAGVATWSVDDGALDLSALSLSPVSRSFDSTSVSLRTIQMSLVLPANSLPAGPSFTFRLSCELTGGYFASSAVEITTNLAPVAGEYSVVPLEGKGGITQFDFTAFSWEDSDLPITYQFSYIGWRGSGVVFRSRLPLAMTTRALPAGLQQQHFEVTTQADVFDNLDAKVSVYQGVSVTDPPIQSAADVHSLFNNAIVNASGNSGMCTMCDCNMTFGNCFHVDVNR